jgi:hypothetical protein
MNFSNLDAESVQAASLTLQSVDNVHRGDCLALAVFRVRDGIANNFVQKVLQDNADFFVDQAGDTFDSSATGQATDSWLGDTVQIALRGLKNTD